MRKKGALPPVDFFPMSYADYKNLEFFVCDFIDDSVIAHPDPVTVFVSFEFFNAMRTGIAYEGINLFCNGDLNRPGKR